MNSMLNILIQSSLATTVLFLLYYAFLRRDTFFKTNRFYLMISLLASAVIPFINFSALLPVREQALLVILDPIIITPEGIQQSVEANTNLYIIGLSIYLTGVSIFSLRFVYQLLQLYLLVKKFGVNKKQGMRMVFTNRNYSPFSFFNLVFMNRNDIDSPEYQKIIAHERVHIRQWHSLDLLVLEIITIFLWFNPFIWFFRHALKTVHEYLADEGVLQSGVDTGVYRALLFEQSTGIQVNDLTNNFSKSLLKRRFIMMTKKRTNHMARAKLIIALPLALSMLVLISFSPNIIAQEKVQDPPPPPAPQENVKAPKAEAKTEKPKKIQLIEYQDEEPVFTVVEVMPKFPGGNKALYAYLGNNIKYPEVAKKEGIEGTVYVTYVVEKDGSVTHVKLLRGVHESLDKEALRVVAEMPKWEPGKEKGKPVRVQYSLPIKYTLAKDKEKEKEKVQNP